MAGSVVCFLVDTGSEVSILATRVCDDWGRLKEELGKYWLWSVEGRALECMGRARLTVTLGTRVIAWDFIVAEISEDEGILGNDLGVAHGLTVRPHEGMVYLPGVTREGTESLGEQLECLSAQSWRFEPLQRRHSL